MVPVCKNIVWAEDDDDDIMIVQSILEQCFPNVRLHIVNNGLQLLDWLDASGHEVPDLLLLDNNMPCKSGKETVTCLQKMQPLQGVPIIIFSTSILPDDYNFFINNGATAYYSKPFGFREMKEAISQIIRHIR